jgi:HEAT repeat protein
MIRTGLCIASASLAAAVFVRPPLQGTDIARRIASAPDGLVKMTYASRTGICGDGRSFIAEGTSSGRTADLWLANGVSVSGAMGDIATRCAPGPVRLLLVVRDHRVIDVQPFVGPSSAATQRAGTELGTVPVADIARYLIDLAKTGRDDTARNALLAASLADSVQIADQLATMARNKSLATTAREAALRWVGRAAAREGNREALRVARSIAEDRDDQIEVRERAIRVIGDEDDGGSAYLRSVYARLDEPTLRERIVRVVAERGTKDDIDWVRGIALDRSERIAVRERAVRLLGETSDSRALRELYDRLDDPTLRERVVRTMADVGDADSRRWLREIVERRSESSALRERAIRSLAEQGDIAFLRSAYGKLEDESLRERVIRSVAESGGEETAVWLRAIVRDTKETSGLRDRAVRSLGESGTATADLVALYDSVADRAVRERLVTILAERGDRAARDKLRSIATDDPDEDLRRRATRKLTENR